MKTRYRRRRKSDPFSGVANSGQIDSGIIAARNALEKWRTTDAAKAEELLKDLDALERLTGQAAKKKALEMIGNL